MKKFLHLKAEIIQSKNEPSLMQTYIESIRSSCYKLSLPDLFVRVAQNSMHSPDQPRQFPEVIENKNQIHERDEADDLKFEEIFEQLHKKTSKEYTENNQKIILNTIIEKLNLLEENKTLIPSIQLIKKIIYNMPLFEHLETLNSLHSPPSTPQSGYRNVHQSMAEENYCLREAQSQQSSICNIIRDAESELKTDTKRISSQEEDKDVSEQSEESIVIKYKRIESYDYEDDKQSSHNSFSSRESEENTMRSQDLNKWEESLARITEKDEEDCEQSSIPEESIEFKKILYMIESGSTQKKTVNKKQSLKQSIHFQTAHKPSQKNSQRTPPRQKQNLIISSRLTKTSKNSSSESQKEQKTKTIKDIVKMLNTKYNRNVTFFK